MKERTRNIVLDANNRRRYYKIYDLNCKYSISPNGFVINTETMKEEKRYCDGNRIYYMLDKRFFYADELVWRVFIGELMGPIKYLDGNEFNLNAYNLYIPLDIQKLSETEWLINDIYFKQIPGFSKYMISLHGTVYTKSLNKIVNRAINHGDYLTVALVSDNGDRSPRKVHRLVYSTFCGELIPGMEIDHKDFNRHNNYYTNLQQISNYENLYRTQSKWDQNAIPFDDIDRICYSINDALSTEEIMTNMGIYPEDSQYKPYYDLITELRDRGFYKSVLKKYEASEKINEVRVGSKRLKAEDIPIIRKMAADKVPVKIIAEKFGVSNVNIYDILNGKKWRDF